MECLQKDWPKPQNSKLFSDMRLYSKSFDREFGVMWTLETAATTFEALNLERYSQLLPHWASLIFLYFSLVHLGYRIRLGSSTDKKDTGRLHVDFAQARDDLYEWECKQRMLAREERHRRRMEEERLRPPSPPPVVHYSDHECSIVAEKLKGIGSI